MKLIKKFLRSIKSKGGYTLVEVAAVVAITATLGAVVVPIAVDKTNEGKKAAANDSTKAIGGAITSFVKDTGNFPAAADGAAGSGTTHYAVLRSGAEEGDVGIAGHDPVVASSINGSWLGKVDVLDNHLTLDNPGGKANSTSPNAGYVKTYRFTNWKGPYSEPFKNTDQWGHNYLVYVKAMHTPTTGASKEYGWIISAGPNGQLQTGVKDSKLEGDDIGYALFSAEESH